jgi:Zn-dependent protease
MSTLHHRSADKFWLSPELRSSLLAKILMIAVAGMQIYTCYSQTKNLLISPQSLFEFIVKFILFHILSPLPKVNSVLSIFNFVPVITLERLNILSDFLSQLNICNDRPSELLSMIMLLRSLELKFNEEPN